MRVAVVTVQVPFIRGGAEILAEGLLAALQAAGHEVELVRLPFKWYPPERILDHMLSCRMLDLEESAGLPIDRIVCLKFPAYLVRHERKVVWLLHQHRTAYELWDHPLADLIHHPRGTNIRDAIRRADRRALSETRGLFTLSENVSNRLRTFCGLESTPLYHPPAQADLFYTGPAEDYLFFPSRITPIKRQSLVLEALASTRLPVRVRFAGAADAPAFEAECRALARTLRVEDRVEWLGTVGEERKRELYARARGVVFTPVDEDYGYVTLEAMLAAKPVVTCSDSGGVLEFVEPGVTGIVAQPEARSLAAALDELWRDASAAERLGAAARARYDELDVRWERVVERLVA